MMNRIPVWLLVLSGCCFSADAQTRADAIPIDTSFTTASAWQAVRKVHPDAEIVVATMDSSVRVARDLVYASPGGRPLRIDVFRPVRAVVAPAVLIIHGGGWRSGDRHQEEPMAIALARNGYVAATIEYRLSAEAKFPAALSDLKAGVRWLRGESAKFGVDTTRIAALGPSAGGTLALLVGTTAGEDRFDGNEGVGGCSSRVEAMISIDGVADLTDPAESGKDTNGVIPSAGARWVGTIYKERPDLWVEASPVHYVDGNSPPVLFVNSAIPRFHAGRDALMEKLKAHGIPTSARTIPDTPHPFWLFHPWFNQVLRQVLEFLDTTFRRDPGERH